MAAAGDAMAPASPHPARGCAPPGEGPETKFSDLNMLVSPGGQERMAEAFAALLVAAGFRMRRIVSVDARLSVIEGVPA